MAHEIQQYIGKTDSPSLRATSALVTFGSGPRGPVTREPDLIQSLEYFLYNHRGVFYLIRKTGHRGPLSLTLSTYSSYNYGFTRKHITYTMNMPISITLEVFLYNLIS